MYILDGFYDNEELNSVLPQEEKPVHTPHDHDSITETTLAISLQALSRIPSANTITVNGVILRHQVHIFVDSGSTHSFINDQLAMKLNLPITTSHNFKLMVSCGE